jgi:hypothetical protein
MRSQSRPEWLVVRMCGRLRGSEHCASTKSPGSRRRREPGYGIAGIIASPHLEMAAHLIWVIFSAVDCKYDHSVRRGIVDVGRCLPSLNRNRA